MIARPFISHEWPSQVRTCDRPGALETLRSKASVRMRRMAVGSIYQTGRYSLLSYR